MQIHKDQAGMEAVLSHEFTINIFLYVNYQ